MGPFMKSYKEKYLKEEIEEIDKGTSQPPNSSQPEVTLAKVCLVYYIAIAYILLSELNKN